jgi:Mn2+/Fe2+ NRAMP family transporter
MLISWLGIDPIKALYYAAALNGLAAPPLMALVILTANNKKIMGKFVNKRIANIVGWMIVLAMTLAGILLIIDLLKGLL